MSGDPPPPQRVAPSGTTSLAVAGQALSMPTLVLGMALATGLLQNSARVANRVVGGQPLDQGVHAWWLTPLGDLIVFSLLVATLVVIGKWFPRARRPGTVWFAVLLIAGLTAAQYVPRLHPLASTVLVLGVSVAAAPVMASSALVARVMRPLTVALAAATLGIAIPMAVWPVVRERLDERGLVDARPGAPNVLVLLWDTVRAASLDLYGYARPTAPNLTEFARSGVTFDRALAPSSYTLPTHASLFTGRWAHELSATWRVPLDGAAPTIGERLGAAGYRTGAFSANRVFVTREWGLGRGFSHFEEHRLGWQQLLRSTALLRRLATSAPVRQLFGFYDQLARVDAEDNNRSLVRWLERDRQRPYFAFVNYFDAHAPFMPADSLATRFGWYDVNATPQERREARALGQLEPEDLGPIAGSSMERAYEGAVAGLDGAVGMLMRELRARGLLTNTIVVIMSDHGEEFGEHGLYNHGNSLYFQSLRVPLVISYPGQIPAGVRVTSTVSIRDVAATIADLAGVPAALPGESLRARWDFSIAAISGPSFSEIRHDPRLPTWARAATGDMMGVVDSTLQVIRYGDGSVEAFDLSTDLSGVTRADTLSDAVRGLRLVLPPPKR
jgi:arylsulfatase A-like enzyme